jgi:hypothetical protein
MPIAGHAFVDRTDDEQAACDDSHRLLQQRCLGALVERCLRAQLDLASRSPIDHRPGEVIIVETARVRGLEGQGSDEDWLLSFRRAELL